MRTTDSTQGLFCFSLLFLSFFSGIFYTFDTQKGTDVGVVRESHIGLSDVVPDCILLDFAEDEFLITMDGKWVAGIKYIK